MLTLNKVNVLENQAQPQGRDISDWPLLDSRGNSLDDLGAPRTKKKTPLQPEKNQIKWREKTPETDDESRFTRRAPPPDDDFSDEDDLDGEEEELEAVLKNKIGNTERNYMYPEHEAGKHNPAKPPMLKFKASLFSRNVLVVNRALKRFMSKDAEGLEEDKIEDEADKRMSKRGEGRVQSSKRRQQMNLKNRYTELTINYDELLKENKLLKQIQKRQERELDRYTNADEDLPRLLDANNYEIAGLKAKNKQLLFEKRELDDKLRRQHQEIVTLKEQNKKLTTLTNNRKLGEREKLELELTTARVTIAHQENKIQDLTKAVEIYKKTADREVRSNALQLKRAQHNLRDLQDAYNELFLKYKAQEKELSNRNIYAQRGRLNSKRSNFRSGYSQPNLTVDSYNSTNSSTPVAGEKKANKESIKSYSNLKSSSLERLESELEELNKQSDSLVDLEKVLEEEAKESLVVPNIRRKSVSTLGSDSEDDLDDDIEDTAPAKHPTPRKEPASKITSPPRAPAVKPEPVKPAPAKPAAPVVDKAEAEAERKRLAEEARIARGNEERKKREEEARKAEEEARRAEEERKRREEKVRVEEEARKRKEAEERSARKEEQQLLKEKKKKDDALKEKLAAVRKHAGGDDFMSQLKAKKNTPSVSPAHSVNSEVKSPAPAAVTTERLTRKSGSGDELRKTATLNNVNSRRRKSTDEDLTSGYQPSFVTKPTAGKTDPFGVEINTNVSEYTPSFSNNQRISRESLNKDKVWTPSGRAASGERNGLFDSTLDQKPLLKRRSSKSKNFIPVKSYEQDDDLEELML